MIILWVTIFSANFVNINFPADGVKVKNAEEKFT
jgi:hypothetical protein